MKESRALRCIDLYFGAALCGFFSLPQLVKRKFVGNRDLSRPRKVLVVELFEMGAAIMASPSLKYLKRQDPNVEIYCLTTSGIAESWRVLGEISPDRIVQIETSGLFRFLLSTFNQWRKLRKIKFDLILDYELFLRASAVLVTLLRGRTKAGFHKYKMEGLFRGWGYNVLCAYNQNLHVAKNFMALTRAGYFYAQDTPNLKQHVESEALTVPTYQGSAECVAAVDRKLEQLYPKASQKKLLVVSPTVGANLPLRDYPLERIPNIIATVLSQNPDVLAVLVGTRGDIPTTSKVEMSVASSRCINLAGQTTLDELLVLMGKADLVFCNDNGIAHFTALTDTPSLALFSMESPFIYGPLGPCTVLYTFYHCSPCVTAFNHKNSKCSDNQCIKQIPEDIVIQYLQKGLNGQLRPRTVNGTVSYLDDAPIWLTDKNERRAA